MKAYKIFVGGFQIGTEELTAAELTIDIFRRICKQSKPPSAGGLVQDGNLATDETSQINRMEGDYHAKYKIAGVPLPTKSDTGGRSQTGNGDRLEFRFHRNNKKS